MERDDCEEIDWKNEDRENRESIRRSCDRDEEPDWDYEAEEVDLCDCGDVATIKRGGERFCAECNLDIAIDETSVRADYAECDGAD